MPDERVVAPRQERRVGERVVQVLGGEARRSEVLIVVHVVELFDLIGVVVGSHERGWHLDTAIVKLVEDLLDREAGASSHLSDLRKRHGATLLSFLDQVFQLMGGLVLRQRINHACSSRSG